MITSFQWTTSTIKYDEALAAFTKIAFNTDIHSTRMKTGYRLEGSGLAAFMS